MPEADQPEWQNTELPRRFAEMPLNELLGELYLFRGQKLVELVLMGDKVHSRSIWTRTNGWDERVRELEISGIELLRLFVCDGDVPPLVRNKQVCVLLLRYK